MGVEKVIIAALTQSYRAITMIQSYVTEYWKFHTVSELDFIPYLGLGRVVNDSEAKLRLLLNLEKLCGNIFVYGNIFLDKSVCYNLIEQNHMVMLVSDESLEYPEGFKYYTDMEVDRLQSQFIRNQHMGLSGLYLWNYDALLDNLRMYKAQTFENIQPGFLQSIKNKGEVVVSSISDAIFQSMKELGLDADIPKKSISELPMEPAKLAQVEQSQQVDNTPISPIPQQVTPPTQPETSVEEVIEATVPEQSQPDDSIDETVEDDTPVVENSQEPEQDEQETIPEELSTSNQELQVSNVVPRWESLVRPMNDDEPGTLSHYSSERVNVVETVKMNPSHCIKVKVQGDILMVQLNGVIMQFPLIDFDEDEWITLSLIKPTETTQSAHSVKKSQIIKSPVETPATRVPHVPQQPKQAVSTGEWTLADVKHQLSYYNTVEELENLKSYAKNQENEVKKIGDTESAEQWHKLHRSIRSKINRLK